MYKKAADLLDQKGDDLEKEEKEVQVVKSNWHGFDFELSIFSDGKIKEIDLEEIDFNVSQEKRCVGNFEGEYTPCPNGKTVEKFNQCEECTPANIPYLKCIFEPQNCDDCERGFCEQEHAVYLTFFGPLPKIGMSQKTRLKKRVIEQGADAYALLSTEEDRAGARKREKKLSKKLDIPQRVNSKNKLKRMSRKINEQTIKRKYRGVENQVPIGELKFLEDYPISLPLRAKPRSRPTPGRHSGKKVGIKGNFLIYENNGLQALNLNDLVGRNMLIRY